MKMGSGITSGSWALVNEQADFDIGSDESLISEKNVVYAAPMDMFSEGFSDGGINIQTGALEYDFDNSGGHLFPLNFMLPTYPYSQTKIVLDYLSVYYYVDGDEGNITGISDIKIGYVQMNPGLPGTYDNFVWEYVMSDEDCPDEYDEYGRLDCRFYKGESPARVGPLNIEIGNKRMYGVNLPISVYDDTGETITIYAIKLEYSILAR